MSRVRLGVFDSGVGGLTVLRALRARFPGLAMVYLGDTARLPYGTKSAETVRRYTERNLRFLAGRGVDAVVVACNSASALALPLAPAALEALGEVAAAARAQNAAGATNTDGSKKEPLAPASPVLPLPVLGVIDAGARLAARSASRRVAVLGTEATVRSGAYTRAIALERKELEVLEIACPLFVPLVEEGWVDDEVTEAVARRYLEPLLTARVDTVVLGCTHYPLLSPLLARILGPQVSLIDSGEAVAEELAVLLADRTDGALPSCGYGDGGANADPGNESAGISEGTLEIFVTDRAGRFARIAEQVLGRPIDLQLVDV